MESENARFLRDAVVDRCRKMTPTERLRAYVEHLRMIKKVYAAGKLQRKRPTGSKRKNA
jgi:hypothetical protein